MGHKLASRYYNEHRSILALAQTNAACVYNLRRVVIAVYS